MEKELDLYPEVKKYQQVPSNPKRILLDTCVVNQLFESLDGYIFGFIKENELEKYEVIDDLFITNELGYFTEIISSLTIAEILLTRNRKLRIKLQQHFNRIYYGFSDILYENEGFVFETFKLSEQEKILENELMKIDDSKTDPIDRLSMIQYKKYNCDAFLTIDKKTLLKHKERLFGLGIKLITPIELLALIKPYIV